MSPQSFGGFPSLTAVVHVWGLMKGQSTVCVGGASMWSSVIGLHWDPCWPWPSSTHSSLGSCSLPRGTAEKLGTDLLCSRDPSNLPLLVWEMFVQQLWFWCVPERRCGQSPSPLSSWPLSHLNNSFKTFVRRAAKIKVQNSVLKMKGESHTGVRTCRDSAGPAAGMRLMKSLESCWLFMAATSELSAKPWVETWGRFWRSRPASGKRERSKPSPQPPLGSNRKGQNTMTAASLQPPPET